MPIILLRHFMFSEVYYIYIRLLDISKYIKLSLYIHTYIVYLHI